MKKIVLFSTVVLLASQSSVVLATELLNDERQVTSSSEVIEDSLSQTQESTVASESSEVNVQQESVNLEESTLESQEQSHSNENERDRVMLNGEWVEIEPEPDNLSYAPPLITEDNQHSLGNTSKSMSRAGVGDIWSNNPTIPRLDFIDVSSHQGEISVNDYVNMKNQGVMGVVVKLTEGTSYINPNASSQIANAKAAGLKVSAYHYSWFTTKASAEAEATYFARAAQVLGLGSDTVMVNDAEQSQINNGRTTENSIYFAAKLANTHNYKKVIHYSMANWFNIGVLDANRLGGKKATWIAQYLYTPSQNNLLHTDAAAWQWGSTLKFVGDSKSRYMDVNIDYNNTFTDGASNGNANVTVIDKKSFIINDKGAIYDRPYVPGANRQDLTTGMKNLGITLTGESVTAYGTWYRFAYNKSGFNKIGWIKSTDISDVINNTPMSKKMYVNTEKGLVYGSPYVPGVPLLGYTNNIENKQVDITEVATTGYGTWYKGTYKQDGQVKAGWIIGTELVSELVSQTTINRKTLIITNGGAIYQGPYIAGTVRQDLTTGMKNQTITLTAESKTSYGTWYQFTYVVAGKNKTGWIKSTDTADIINQTNVTKKMYVNKENGVVYAAPYVAGTQRKGVTTGFDKKEFNVTEVATTGYGTWYQGSYKQDGQIKSGWIKADDLVDQLVAMQSIIINGKGAIYNQAYVPGTIRQDLTTGMRNQMINIVAETKTPYGTWYQFNYQKSGTTKTGWVKSTDVVLMTSINKKATITNSKGAIYESPYVAGTARLDLTTGMGNQSITLTGEAKTAYGTWYRFNYTKAGQVKVGWIKSSDIK